MKFRLLFSPLLSKKRFVALMLIATLNINCAHQPHNTQLPATITNVARESGASVHWQQGTPEDAEVDAFVDDLLTRPLELAAVVQIGLLRNPDMQVFYEELGIAQADLIQAGLLSNPAISAAIRFPESDEGSDNLEFVIAQSFLDILMLPMRKKMAQAHYDVATLETAHEIHLLIGSLETAYFEYIAALQLEELVHNASIATEAAAELALKQFEAGNLSRLQLSRESAFHAETLLELDHASLESRRTREELAQLMGLWQADLKWTLDQVRLPQIPTDETLRDDIEAFAIANRQDLAARVRNLEALAYGVHLERKWRWLGFLDISVSTERDTDGAYVTGPELELQLPLFDQGQAKLLASESTFRSESHRITALAMHIRHETRRNLDAFLTNRERVRFMERVVLPAHESIIEEAQRHNNAMLLGVYELLLDKRAQIEAGKQYVESVRDYWVTRSQLEMTIGGALIAPSANDLTDAH